MGMKGKGAGPFIHVFNHCMYVACKCPKVIVLFSGSATHYDILYG